MKRALVIWFFVAALVAMGCSPPPDSFGRVGTLQDSWIEIWDWYDLDAIRHNLSGSYVLMTDLDSATTGYADLAGPDANDGKGWQPIAVFVGVLHGQEYQIRDLFIHRPNESYIGLFGYVGSGGVVEHLGVTDATVTGWDWGVGTLVGFNCGAIDNCYASGLVAGDHRVGGLVGYNYGLYGGTIDNCYSTCRVDGRRDVGGLVGENEGRVSHSYATGSVTGEKQFGGLVGLIDLRNASVVNSYATGSVSGKGYPSACGGGLAGGCMGSSIIINSWASGNVSGYMLVGGLVGALDSGSSVTNSCATGNVASGWRYAGGLAGRNWAGKIDSCYSTGRVTGNRDVGGLVGYSYVYYPKNSFWDIETSGMTRSAGGTGKTTLEMMDTPTFTDTSTVGLDKPWDIVVVPDTTQRDTDYIWNIVDAETYPFLSWQPLSVVLHDLTISSTDGGSVSEPGEETYTYEDGTVVNLVATAAIGHDFVNWTGDVDTIDNVNSAETTITMDDNYSIVANFEPIAGVQTQCVESATGTGTACVTTSHGFIEDLQAVPPHSLPSVLFPHGMFSFRITGLTEGQTVTVTIEFPSPLPIGTLWWKYDNGRWYGLPNESNNGDHIMVISLTDGGVHDLDDVPGQITDPGGPGYPLSLGYTVGWETRPINKVAVMAPWIGLLAAIAGASLLVLRRRQTQS